MRARRGTPFVLCCLCFALATWIAAPALADHHEAAAGQDAHAGHGEMQQGEMSAEEQAAMAAWQKAMTPGPQHAELAKTAGEWDLALTMWMEPGAEPTKSTATATRSMLWDRILVEDVQGDMMGMTFKGHGMTGYDNVTGEWWSTWMDNMSTGMMKSTGTWDEESGTATYSGESVDPMTGKPMKVRMVVTPGADKETMVMYMTPEGGDEHKSMEIVYTRK